ncbi:hypothetical protein CPB86DRAFT_779748 [Serendipita vermifera]|nr:hypothetical protein CPB86DRAFT_779748 [Serendipita vermifera]
MSSLIRSINPLDRELRHNGLFSFEKSALRQLRRSRWISSPFSITLPYEIWDIILNLVVAHLADPSIKCNSRTFPRYQSLLTHYESPDRKDWARMRLVCRAWRDILDPCPHMVISFLKMRINSAGAGMPKGTKSLFIQWGCPEPLILMKSLLMDPRMSNSIVTLAIGGNLGTVGQCPIELLLQGEEINFPSLRCFTLGWFPPTTSPVLHNFWDRINQKFPQLVSLTLRLIPAPPGHVSLPNLQTLDFFPQDRSDITYDLPSLKHCSLHGVVWVDHILESCSQSLESLIVHTGGIALNTEFWKRYPLLQMMGISAFSNAFDVTNSPPSDHPLSHLQLIIPYGWQGDKVKIIKDTLPFFPNLKFLSIDKDIQLTRSDLAQYPSLQVLPVPVPFRVRRRRSLIFSYIGDVILYGFIVMLQISDVCVKFFNRFRRKRPPIQLGPSPP